MPDTKIIADPRMFDPRARKNANGEYDPEFLATLTLKKAVGEGEANLPLDVAHTQYLLASRTDFNCNRFWCGPLDGKWSKKLRNAIMAMQTFLNFVDAPLDEADNFPSLPSHEPAMVYSTKLLENHALKHSIGYGGVNDPLDVATFQMRLSRVNDENGRPFWTDPLDGQVTMKLLYEKNRCEAYIAEYYPDIAQSPERYV